MDLQRVVKQKREVERGKEDVTPGAEEPLLDPWGQGTLECKLHYGSCSPQGKRLIYYYIQYQLLSQSLAVGCGGGVDNIPENCHPLRAVFPGSGQVGSCESLAVYTQNSWQMCVAAGKGNLGGAATPPVPPTSQTRNWLEIYKYVLKRKQNSLEMLFMK